VIIFLLVVMRLRAAATTARGFAMLFRSRCGVLFHMGLLHVRLLDVRPGRLVLFEARP